MARWYWAPPKSRMCALGRPSGTGSVLESGPTNAPVSQSVDHIFFSRLGLITCLTLIVRISTQHHIHTFKETLNTPVLTTTSTNDKTASKQVSKSLNCMVYHRSEVQG